MPQLDIASFPSQLFWLAVIFVLLLVVMAVSYTHLTLPTKA